MSDLHDLKRYKESLVLLPHLKDILKITEKWEAVLFKYKKYMPVAKMLMTISDQRDILKNTITYYEKVNKLKGKK